MLFRKVPFIMLTSAFVGGIVLARNLEAGLNLIPLQWLLLLILPLTLYLFRRKMNPALPGLVVLLFVFLAGYNLYRIRMNPGFELDNSHNKLVVKALDYSQRAGYLQRLPVVIILANGKNLHGWGRNIMLYFKNGTGRDITPGNRLLIECPTLPVTDMDTTDSFDYREQMAMKGFRYVAFPGSVVRVEGGRPGLKERALIFRNKLMRLYRKSGISGDNLAVLSALTLGEKSLLNNDIRSMFSRSGVMHILAVSGLHVGILSMFLLWLLSSIPRRFEHVRVVLVISVIWLFAFIAGLNPPVTRAALMFSILIMGRLVQRPVNNLNLLMATAFIMLVVNPALFFDAGFRLSFSAVIFIIVFYKDLVQVLTPTGKIATWVWEITAVSILAQAGTLPLVIAYFGNIPLVSVVTNIIAIPVAFIVLTGGLLLLLTISVPLLPSLITYLINFILEFFLGFLQDVSSLPFSSVRVEPPGNAALLCLMVSLFITLVFLLKKNIVHLHLVIFSLILLFLLI